MPCEKCEALNGTLYKVNKQPHDDLVLIKEQNLARLTGGQARGYARTYECKVCMTHMYVDTDKQDDFAGWSIVK